MSPRASTAGISSPSWDSLTGMFPLYGKTIPLTGGFYGIGILELTALYPHGKDHASQSGRE